MSNEMKTLFKCLKSLHYGFWLGLLSFWLVTIVLPAVAIDIEEYSTTVRLANLEASRFLNKDKAACEVRQFRDTAEYWQQATQKYQRVRKFPIRL